MNNTFIKALSLASTMALLTACGGGGDNSDGSVAPPETPPEVPIEIPRLNEGGTLTAPAPMSLEGPNEIKSDTFFNYFKVSVNEGDELVIKSTLHNDLDTRVYSRCDPALNPSIQISGEVGSCSLNLKHKFKIAREYLVHINYPDNNFGYFDADLIKENTTSTLENGRPNSPYRIITDGSNIALDSNDFYNHFYYDAKSGDTLHIQTYPDIAPSATDAARCGSSSAYDNYYSYGVYLYRDTSSSTDDWHSCSGKFEHTFEEDGRYLINIRFKHRSAGYMRALVQR